MKKLADLLRRAADRLDPPPRLNVLTLPPDAAERNRNVDEAAKYRLDGCLEAPYTVGPGAEADYLLTPDGRIVRNPARGG